MQVPPEIINNMGSLSLAQGDYEKARDYYQKAMDILAVSPIYSLSFLKVALYFEYSTKKECYENWSY